MSLLRQAGSRVPILMSSLGRAYLAFCTAAKIERVLDALATSADPFDAPAGGKSAARRMLSETRKRGYAIPNPLYIEKIYQNHVSGMSVPVFEGDDVIAAVGVMYHTAAMSAEDAKRTLLPKLLELAATISEGVSAELDRPGRSIDRQKAAARR